MRLQLLPYLIMLIIFPSYSNTYRTFMVLTSFSGHSLITNDNNNGESEQPCLTPLLTKSLLVNVQFLNQIPVGYVSPLQSTPKSAKIAINPTQLILSNAYSKSGLHSKHTLYCCFLNFFYTSLSVPPLHRHQSLNIAQF